MFFVIPIGSDKAVYGLPWVTIGLIVTCVMVYVADITGFNAIAQWGFRPSAGLGVNVVLCTFVHGGFLHLLGNMLFLWGMGVNLEARWGPGPFALLYFVGGIAATLAYAVLHPSSSVALVGASGAISTCMGAFLVSFFTSRVRIAYWILFKFGTWQVPAYVLLPFWFISDLWGAYGEATVGSQGVAYSAHVGGFLLGVAGAAALKFGGLEKRLMHARGSDAWDDAAQWTEVAENVAPTAPWRCRVCQLVNAAGTAQCRRCRAKP